MRLFLIRHAQSQNNALPQEQRVEDPPITELGHRQAQSLAKIAPSLQLTHLVTSPFLRTLQTTDYMREATGLTPYVKRDLHEVGGCVSGPSPEVMVGRPGLTRTLILEQFKGYEVEADIDGDGWWRSRPYETFEDARHRAKRLWDHTLSEYVETDARVGYVMHADFKVVFVGHVHSDRVNTPLNTSIATLDVASRGEVRLTDYNNVAHLTPDLLSC